MPAETTEFVGRGFLVEIGKIDRELKAIWEQGEDAMTRASLMNFAIYSEQPGSFEKNTDFIGEFTADHACRAIVISANPTATENRVLAWISAHCHVSRAGAKQVCCEQISFQLDGPSSKLIPNIVFSHLDSDLPLIFWWQGELPDPIDEQLWKWIDRLIYDSLDWCDPVKTIHRLKGSIDECGSRTTLCDLNWTRTWHLRDAIAQVYDHPTVLAKLSDLNVIEFDHAPGARLSAMFVAGWFATQMRWTLEELGSSASCLRFADAETGRPIQVKLNETDGNIISRVRGAHGDGFFEIKWAQDSHFLDLNVSIPHEHAAASRLLPSGKPDLLELVSDELGRGGAHRIYLRMLDLIDPVLHLAAK